MQLLFGIFFHFIGGAASGSFYIPYKKVRGWSWESYWIVGGLFSWLIVPPLAAWMTVPHFGELIAQASPAVLGWTFFWGLLWGVGGLLYGLGVRYLGLSLGNSVLLGFTSAFGALVPSLYYDIVPTPGKTGFHELLYSSWGRIVLAGIGLCLAGIFICGRAGVLKGKELPEEKKKESIKEFNLARGLIVCTLSGILSACFNYGIEAGGPLATAANQLWKQAHPAATTEFLYRNNTTYIVLLWGGLTTNFIWCMVLNARNRTFGDYTNKMAPLTNNYFFSAMAGTIWFLQFFFYGMGESRLGNGASSWILHMAFIILVANAWGIVLKEWKGVSTRTRLTITMGIVAILLSVMVVGYGNSLK